MKTKKLLEKMNVYAEDIQDDGNALLLHIMNKNKQGFYEKYKSASILKDIYTWIKKGIDIHFPDEPISNYSYMANTENVEEVCKMIAAFGTGITDFQIVEEPVEKIMVNMSEKQRGDLLSILEKNVAKLRGNPKYGGFSVIMRNRTYFSIISVDRNEEVECKTIKFYHNKKSFLFELSEESDGTVRILDLLEILLSESGKTYVIDELDRCLHPSLTYKFVEIFFEFAAKKEVLGSM